MGGKGSKGVRVAYEAGSSPGGVRRPLTAESGWNAASPSGKRSPGDSLGGETLLGATMTVSGARSLTLISSMARGRRQRGRAGDWITRARGAGPTPRPASCKHPCFFTLAYEQPIFILHYPIFNLITTKLNCFSFEMGYFVWLSDVNTIQCTLNLPLGVTSLYLLLSTAQKPFLVF